MKWNGRSRNFPLSLGSGIPPRSFSCRLTGEPRGLIEHVKNKNGDLPQIFFFSQYSSLSGHRIVFNGSTNPSIPATEMHRLHQSIVLPFFSFTIFRRRTRPHRSHRSVTTFRAIVILPSFPAGSISLFSLPVLLHICSFCSTKVRS